MRYVLFALSVLLVTAVGLAGAEDKPAASPAPSASAAEISASPTPTPKPTLEPGVDADGLVLKLEGPFHYKMADGVIVEPVDIAFRLETAVGEKELDLNTNPYACMTIEVMDDANRKPLEKTGDFPKDGKAFKLILSEGSYYGGVFKGLQDHFDLSEGGRFWVRAKYKLGEKEAVSDWTALDIYTRVVVRIKTREGEFVIWLREDKAPRTCENFEKLVKKGFYDHLIFHRVENRPNFKLIQGGCPHGDGTGGPGYTIDFEDSGLKHEAGAVGMGLTGNDKNSAGSQFYICVEPIPSLDGRYCVFGKVIEGMDTVKRICAVQTRTDMPNRPKIDVEMEKVTLEYWK